MSETYAIASDGLTARISTFGAELVSLTDARGNEWMTDGDPAVWAGHAPILFPFVGELAGGKLRLDGAEYDLARHGFARHGFARRREFACVEHEQRGQVRFRLSDDEETRAVYPFRFELDLHYQVAGTTLTMTATVRNRDDSPMPFSIGFHPGFAWPLPEGGDKLKHRIVFAGFEPGPVRRLDGDGLLLAYEDTPVSGRVLNLRPSLFDADAMIWDQLSSRALAFEGGAPEGKGATPAALEMHFPDCPMLGIWQKPGADFLCIEPWAGVADASGFDGDFRAKPGIMELPPGEERSFAMTITIRPATAGA